MSALPRIVITTGEPAGIGPDIVLSLAQNTWPGELVVIADPQLMQARAHQLDLALQLTPFDAQAPAQTNRAGELKILAEPLNRPARAGLLDAANAEYVLRTLKRAALGTLQGSFDALVTAPVHKGIINEAGIAFSGHTEYLAALAGDVHPVMLLVADALRVALVTTHLPLKDVSAAIDTARLERVIRILDHDLRQRFALDNPHILVCGLNPHAGEDGHLGREEIEIITPTLQTLRARGLNLSGPLPADTVFTPRHLKTADAVLAMYHDQGLPVLKHAGFGRAVNITLGLPFIRTSVDHGTALDLAGSGQAQTGSLKAALELAIELAHKNKTPCPSASCTAS